MQLHIGGVHTNIEQAKLLKDLRTQLAPDIFAVNWLPRSQDNGAQRRVTVEGCKPDQFEAVRTSIQTALALNARDNYQVVEHDAVPAKSAWKSPAPIPAIEASGKPRSNQFQYIPGESESTVAVLLP